MLNGILATQLHASLPQSRQQQNYEFPDQRQNYDRMIYDRTTAYKQASAQQHRIHPELIQINAGMLERTTTKEFTPKADCTSMFIRLAYTSISPAKATRAILLTLKLKRKTSWPLKHRQLQSKHNPSLHRSTHIHCQCWRAMGQEYRQKCTHPID